MTARNSCDACAMPRSRFVASPFLWVVDKRCTIAAREQIHGSGAKRIGPGSGGAGGRARAMGISVGGSNIRSSITGIRAIRSARSQPARGRPSVRRQVALQICTTEQMQICTITKRGSSADCRFMRCRRMTVPCDLLPAGPFLFGLPLAKTRPQRWRQAGAKGRETKKSIFWGGDAEPILPHRSRASTYPCEFPVTGRAASVRRSLFCGECCSRGTAWIGGWC
jgi:hypothetical protein